MEVRNCDIDILITSRTVDRKIMQPLRIRSGFLTGIGKQNQSNQFKGTFNKVMFVIAIEKR